MTKLILFASLLLCITSKETQASNIEFTCEIKYNLTQPIQKNTNKERAIKNLDLWCSHLLQELSLFEAQHQTDFLDREFLKKGLKSFGSCLIEELTPPSCKFHLVKNIIDNLDSKPLFFKVSELVPMIKKELEQLKPKLLALIKSGDLKENNNWDEFVRIKPKSYFLFIRNAVEKSRFKEYKKTMKDWVISVDTLMNGLGVDEEREKYKYKSKLIALNLSKLFRVEHGLIDFSAFINPIIKELKTKDFSIKLSEIDALFAASIADVSSSIYANLTNLYNAEMEKGSFGLSFDTLEIALPRMFQIQHAILNAKE
jgi:hypothetical protein